MTPQKTCPKCSNKTHVKTKICKTESCGHIFTKKKEDYDDDDHSDDEEFEVPERSCSVCGDLFSPKLSKKTILGDPVWLWMHDNYCSTHCSEQGENILFNFIYGLIYSSELVKNKQNSNDENKFEKILANQVFSYKGSPEIEIPSEVVKIVNPENFVLRNSDGNVDAASFIKLTSPRFPVKSQSESHQDNSGANLNIKPSKEFEKTFKPAPKNISEIADEYPENTLQRKVADDLNLPVGNFLDEALSDPEIAKEAKNSLSPGKGKRLCPNCNEVVPGGRSKQCVKCGNFFPPKNK